MKANTIINKAKFVGLATAGTVVGSTAKCAIITTSIAAPAILGMSLGDKLVKGKWNVKKNTIGFLEGAAVASAVYVGCHTAKTLVCALLLLPSQKKNQRLKISKQSSMTSIDM